MKWFRNIKIQNRLSLVFGSISLLAALSAGWGIWTALRLQNLAFEMQRQANRAAAVQQAQNDLFGQRLAAKNYALTGSTYYAGRFSRLGQKLDDYTRQALLEAQSVNQLEDLNSFAASQNETQAIFNQAIANAGSQESEGAAGIQSRLEGERIDAAASRSQIQLENMAFKHSLELLDLLQAVQKQVRISVAGGAAALILLLALAILAGLAGNQVTEPVLHLTNAVVAFECDVFEPAMLEKYAANQDEMGQLSRSVTNMAASIHESDAAKDRLLAAAARFIPMQYLDFLEKDSITEIKLGDHVSAEMAVMFSDVRGFTTLSEAMTPQQNFDFVNEYLQLVSPIIQKHDGFIVKFLGDGMMAIFPYSVDDAVKAGIEKQRQVLAFNQELARRGLPPISVGIGIHTGHMMVGMIGEELRMQGDAFSDNVNLTSRVEGLTKFYGTALIITEESLMRLERPIPYQIRFLGKARVKGRLHPIALYEVFDGDPPELAKQKAEIKEAFEHGLKLYMAGRLSEAHHAFQAVLQRYPQDQTTAFYLERISEWLDQELPEDWDGVEIMTSK